MSLKELKEKTLSSDKAFKKIECQRKKCHIMFEYAMFHCHSDIAEGFATKYNLILKERNLICEENKKNWEEYSNALKNVIV